MASTQYPVMGEVTAEKNRYKL